MPDNPFASILINKICLNQIINQNKRKCFYNSLAYIILLFTSSQAPCKCAWLAINVHNLNTHLKKKKKKKKKGNTQVCHKVNSDLMI